MLAVLEVSLSFDNAIINAKELENMWPKWRKRFLTRWMIIAVFGMRIIFPLAIVSIVGDISMWQALHIALQNPEQYKILIESSHISLAGFGWAFLLMVFMWFFLDEAKEIHWIAGVEKQLAKRWKLESIWVALTLIVIRGTSKLPGFPTEETGAFLASSIMWVVIFLVVSALSSLLQEGEKSHATKAIATWGFWAFMYLQVLDASFSFDWVIWAFALTKNIVTIALWLWIGAMFVRSLTLMLVERKTLSHFKYLEHGAFWAIWMLAVIMFLTSTYHIPEALTWIGSWVLIVISLLHSKYANRKH